MRVLITSAALELPRELATSLGSNNQVRLTDRSDVSTDLEFIRCDLGHDQTTNGLVRGMDAIVHSGQVDPAASASEQLDFQTRCTYNLLWAAVEEGVPRFIYLSSLAVMGRYDEDLAVTERWRPVPSTEAPVLCHHLGEYVCREFAREGSITILSLRLGDIVRGQGAIGSSALHFDDALRAVECALNANVSGGQPAGFRPVHYANRWGVFHIQSPVPGARFLTKQAEEQLGYKPTFKG